MKLHQKVLKLIQPSVKDPLVHILNLSLSQGIFPSELKIANVLPLYKADDPMHFNNYRPVSLLNILSKVFEKNMYSRLISFLNLHRILLSFQFGFRKNHSTYMALLILINKLTKALENGEFIIGIFLDFSKALILLIIIYYSQNCTIMAFAASH